MEANGRYSNGLSHEKPAEEMLHLNVGLTPDRHVFTRKPDEQLAILDMYITTGTLEYDLVMTHMRPKQGV